MKKNPKGLIQKIKRAYRKGDILQKIFCLFLIKINFSNDELQALEIRYKKFTKLEKKYSKFLENIKYEKNLSKDKTNDNIWILWMQGIDKAPDVVRECISTVKFHMKDKKIHIVTQENLLNYIELPDFIMNKWKKGIITNAHLSDIIRTELLIKYGGTWIDATTYLTAPIPQYFYNENCFMYRCKYKGDISIRYNSWLIYAEKDNRLLKVTKDLLYRYWQKENRLKEYFLWHFFMTMAVQKYPEDEREIPYFSDEMSHMLQYSLLKNFDSKYWNEIKKLSSVHKLTYKINLPENIDNTYYKHIIEDKVDKLYE